MTDVRHETRHGKWPGRGPVMTLSGRATALGRYLSAHAARPEDDGERAREVLRFNKSGYWALLRELDHPPEVLQHADRLKKALPWTVLQHISGDIQVIGLHPVLGRR
jgi:hypothetical protein